MRTGVLKKETLSVVGLELLLYRMYPNLVSSSCIINTHTTKQALQAGRRLYKHTRTSSIFKLSQINSNSRFQRLDILSWYKIQDS